MIETKGKQVLTELMQFGYDHNVIALVNMNGKEEIAKHFDDMTGRLIAYAKDWFANSKKKYGKEYKNFEAMRFCFTIGIGAAWFWENRKDEVDGMGLYECMAEPRTEFEMDEYIEDMVGIWYSSSSDEHNKFSILVQKCMSILYRHFNLADDAERHTAGHVMMLFGMYCGYTRLYREWTKKHYEGNMPWHNEVWEALYGEGDHSDEYDQWAIKALKEGKCGLGRIVIDDDPNSEYGKIRRYHYPAYYKEDAGIKVLYDYNDNKNIELFSAMPLLTSGRSYHLVIDSVYVWENGAEATIEAHFHDDEDFSIRFYDTHYLENKDYYFAGQDYTFDLYGIAYQAKVVPEEERSFKFEGEKAVNFNKKVGHETKYDENGIPEPVVFMTGELHSFIQVKDDLPEDASFRSPIKAVYEDVDYLGKKVYELEIGMPYHKTEHDEDKHPLSVFVAADCSRNFTCRPKEGDPIYGVLYLQGKMINRVNWHECPSTILHTFDAREEDGTTTVFTHVCEKEELGQPMTSEEQQAFAKEVLYRQLSGKVKIWKNEEEKPNKSDFKADRKREFWVMADANYTASSDFVSESKDRYLGHAFTRRYIPVIVYVTLYDLNGDKCQWLKGGRYTAKIHYGSVVPGQKMELIDYLDHDELVEVLCESFEKLDTTLLARYLHKDLDFRSDYLADPIISRDEYVIRTEGINNIYKNSNEWKIKAQIIKDDEQGDYIELQYYPKGTVDTVKVKTENGFITAIKIEKKK